MWKIINDHYGEFTDQLLQAVCEYNEMSPSDEIHVDQEIKLPSKAELGIE